MAKAKVNFYWKGKYYEVGNDAPDDTPKHVLVDEPKPIKKTKERKLKLDKK